MSLHCDCDFSNLTIVYSNNWSIENNTCTVDWYESGYEDPCVLPNNNMLRVPLTKWNYLVGAYCGKLEEDIMQLSILQKLKNDC